MYPLGILFLPSPAKKNPGNQGLKEKGKGQKEEFMRRLEDERNERRLLIK
uniref:Uncharacterized protein n=1 Tax=Ascaris lumbricoides TaxID=6252 RepID=A0A0M3HKE0_ASCLU